VPHQLLWPTVKWWSFQRACALLNGILCFALPGRKQIRKGWCGVGGERKQQAKHRQR